MGVDHGGFYIAMAESFLNRTDVGSLFQKVRGERMAEGVAGRRFADPRCLHGCTHGALHKAPLAADDRDLRTPSLTNLLRELDSELERRWQRQARLLDKLYAPIRYPDALGDALPADV